MNLTRPSDVRRFLRENDLHPNRTLGQNFLIDGNILAILLDAAALQPDDVVLEVGPGLGVVTEGLLDRVSHVIAIEKDSGLHALLAQRLRDSIGFECRLADMLEVDVDALLAERSDAGRWKLVSNLPYSVGSRILVNMAGLVRRPDRMAVTVQQEVAERLAASPGNKDYGTLSLLVQLAYEVELVKRVSPNCFMPRPDVWSAIVAMELRSEPLLARALEGRFRELVKHIFTHRRKQLAAILRKAPAGLRLAHDETVAFLESRGRDPRSRPEGLSVEDMCALVRRLGES